MGRLDHKVCLITGAARGQGAEEARLFSDEGAEVWMCDVLDDLGQPLARDLGAQYRHLDITDEIAWQALILEIMATSGAIHGLVNNAAIFRVGRLKTTSSEEFQQVMKVNTLGVFLGMKAVAEPMTDSGGGAIVNISSMAGLRAAAGSFAYGASKWAVTGMTKTAAVELARKGIRVNSIHPGLIETPMVEDVPINKEGIIRRTPLGRIAQAREVARMALFLTSDESSYSTGSEFIIDGGLNAL